MHKRVSFKSGFCYIHGSGATSSDGANGVYFTVNIMILLGFQELERTKSETFMTR